MRFRRHRPTPTPLTPIKGGMHVTVPVRVEAVRGGQVWLETVAFSGAKLASGALWPGDIFRIEVKLNPEGAA